MHLPLAKLIGWLIAYRYALLFPVLVFEGPIVTVLAGLLVALGRLDFLLSYVVAVTADLTGDTLYYLAGRHFMRMAKVRRWLRLDADSEIFARLRGQFDAHPGKTLLAAKLTHGAGVVALTGAGVAGMPFRSFLGWNLAGTLVKSLVLLLLGYYFGYAYRAIDTYLGLIAFSTFALALLCGLGWMALRTRRRFQTRGT